MEALNIKKNIPNILTIFRILLLVPIIVLLLCPSIGVCYTIKINDSTIDISINKIIVLVLFLIASFTDFLDGFLSRKYNWISDFGKILDPIADKILINSIFIIFSYNMELHVIFPIIFITRDVVVDALRMNIASKKIIIPANIWGKIKTVLQMVSIVVILVLGTPSSSSIDWYYWGVQSIFIYLSVIISLVSGFIYIAKFISIKKAAKSEKVK